MEPHLSSGQIDDLLHLGSGSDDESSADPISASARAHLQSCAICQTRMRAEQEVIDRLARLKPGEAEAAGSNCPGEDLWLQIAAGMNVKGLKDLLYHAAECDHCGPLLQDASADMAEGLSSEELRAFRQLQSNEQEWQSMLVRKMTALQDRQPVQQLGKAERSRSWLALPRLAFGFGGLTAICASVWFGFHLTWQPSVQQLLAQAYTKQRTLEIRIRDASYAPMRVTRGDSQSNVEKPLSLLEAEAEISVKLAEHPDDPESLREKANADLLDGNYDSAIRSLERGLEVQPGAAELLADLGAAYYVRAKFTEQPSDYGRAVEDLSKAMVKSPDNTVALFNRALACEQLFLYSQAIDDWKRYLSLDPQSAWADEARKHLAQVLEKVQAREKSLAEPLLTPEEIEQRETQEAALEQQIDERIEDYLKLATTKWCPMAFSESPSEESRTAEAALAVVAQTAKERHDDPWLHDLISSEKGNSFRAGIKALAASVLANERGDHQEGQTSAHTAVQYFRDDHNPAGELRAMAEEVYSDHLLWEGERCISSLESLEKLLEPTSYVWIKGQMSFERSNCADLTGEESTYQSAITDGLDVAQKHRYDSLFLRGLGFESLAMASLGKTKDSVCLAEQGLGLFWGGRADLMKGYNLYTDLDAAADIQRLPYFQVILSREATALIDQHPDLLLRAMAHRWYGNAAYLANLPDLATQEFTKASALFASSPRTAGTQRELMDAEIWLAHIEIRQGDLDRAAARLESVKPTLDATPGFNPEIGFYTSEAEIAIKRGESTGAERANRVAIFLAEWGLNSLSSSIDRRDWTLQTADAYRNLVEWKLRSGDGILALELWEWFRGAEYRISARRLDRESAGLETSIPPDLRDLPAIPTPTLVSDQLSSLRDQSVVAYGAFEDGIAVWVYDDRGVVSQWIPTPLPAVTDLIVDFRRLCSDPNSDTNALRTTARTLYDLLIAPIEGKLDAGRTLLFEPDDRLAGIPWEALLDSRSRYLAQRAPTILAPALYERLRLRSSKAISPEAPALVVSVAAADGLPPLSDAEIEAQEVAGSFKLPAQLHGGDATLSAIRRSLHDRVVFHFAGHALASPQFTGLVLSERDPRTHRPRVIAADNLTGTEMGRLQLVVLSACNPSEEPEETTSVATDFTQSLLHAGVPHVLVSRWSVDSAQTAKFMKAFYAKLLSGSDASVSTQTARLVLISQRASAHPYYWSAFALQGNQ